LRPFVAFGVSMANSPYSFIVAMCVSLFFVKSKFSGFIRLFAEAFPTWRVLFI
jgi:hypothetical protein